MLCSANDQRYYSYYFFPLKKIVLYLLFSSVYHIFHVQCQFVHKICNNNNNRAEDDNICFVNKIRNHVFFLSPLASVVLFISNLLNSGNFVDFFCQLCPFFCWLSVGFGFNAHVCARFFLSFIPIFRVCHLLIFNIP